ncbi:MAG TPA: cytosine permease [Alphaproteobacteria bacterium]|nr:cytosine permease [Alphaproteobacteria bacterium]
MPKIRMENTQHSLITEGVQSHEQTLATIKPFWVFFVGNIGVSVWLLGVLIAGMGLNFADAMFVILLSSLVGTAFPALTSILGPLTRLSQMEAGRFSLGRTGKKLPAFLNWVGAIGWDTINNVLSGAAFVSFLAVIGLHVPFWLALGVLVFVQMLIGIYGHHLIQDTSQYTGIVLGFFFAVIGIIAMHKTGVTAPTAPAAAPKDVLGAFLLLMAYSAVSWTTYTADYTRYLPAKTSSKKVFTSVFFGLFLSFLALTFFGYVTASAVTEQAPEGVMHALQNLTGKFAPLVLFLIAFNSIPVNAINDNSAAYSLMSAGLKISRPLAAAVGAILGYVICILASSSFVDFYENFLFLFAHWVTPWAAILLVHWFCIGKKEQVTISGITRGSIIFVLVSALSIVLFSANSLYTGLLSNRVGGADIGPYIGFVTAGLIYYVSLKLWPQKYRAAK